VREGRYKAEIIKEEDDLSVWQNKAGAIEELEHEDLPD
jgi:hypothetical protein